MAYNQDFTGQEINVGDYVCCTSASGSTGMYIAQVKSLADKKAQVVALDGKTHSKAFNKMFVVNGQIQTNPSLLL